MVLPVYVDTSTKNGKRHTRRLRWEGVGPERRTGDRDGPIPIGGAYSPELVDGGSRQDAATTDDVPLPVGPGSNRPIPELEALIKSAGVILPTHIRNSGVVMLTRKKLGRDRLTP